MDNKDTYEKHEFKYGYRTVSDQSFVQFETKKSDSTQSLVADIEVDVQLKMDGLETEIVSSQQFEKIIANKWPHNSELNEKNNFELKLESATKYYIMIKASKEPYYGLIKKYYDETLKRPIEKLEFEINNVKTEKAINTLFDFQRRLYGLQKILNFMKMEFWRDEPSRIQRLKDLYCALTLLKSY